MTDSAVTQFRPLDLMDRISLQSIKLTNTLSRLQNLSREAISFIAGGKQETKITDLSENNRELAVALLRKDDIQHAQVSKVQIPINVDSLKTKDEKTAAMILNFYNAGKPSDGSSAAGRKKITLINQITQALGTSYVSYQTDIKPEIDSLRDIQAYPKDQNGLTPYLEGVKLPPAEGEGVRFSINLTSPLFTKLTNIFGDKPFVLPTDEESLDMLKAYKNSMTFLLLGSMSRFLEKRKNVSLERLMNLKEHENFRVLVKAINYFLTADSNASNT